MPTNSMVRLVDVLPFIILELLLFFLWVAALLLQLEPRMAKKKTREAKLMEENYPFEEGKVIIYSQEDLERR